MIERMKAKMAKMNVNHMFHRAIYGGLAITYSAGYLGADKDLIYLLAMTLYFLMAIR